MKLSRMNHSGILASFLLALGSCTGYSLCAYAQNYPFAASDIFFQHNLNVYWYTYGECENEGYSYNSCCGLSPDWAEWDSMKFDWTAHGGHRATEIQWLERTAKVDGVNG